MKNSAHLAMTRIEPFSITEVLQVFVVGENEERLCSSLQPVPPFFEGQLDCKKFSIGDVVILLRRAEFPGEESTWMESGRRPLLLGEHRVINQFNIELLFQLRELVIKYSILLG